MLRPGTSNGAGRRGFALLMVVLTIAALAILATPFMVSMKLQERSSRTAVAQARARYAMTAAYNHALAQLLQAAHEYGEMAVRFDDLPEEFKWQRSRRGLMLDAEVQDEQGKVNVNSAPAALMANLFADEELGLGLSRAAAVQLAAAIAMYREARGAFPSIDTLVTEQAFTPQQLDALRPHVTVHAAAERDGGFALINLNTASTPVLRAALTGIRMKYVEPVPDTGNAGNGAMSLVELSADTSGVWEVTCTATLLDTQTDAKKFTFAIESYPENDPGDRTSHGTVDLIEYPNTPAGVWKSLDGVTFSLFNGTTDFDVGDKFTFSAERFSYYGDEFDPEPVNTLLKWFRAKVVTADVDGGTITLDDGLRFPVQGWVRINGDLIRYTGRADNELQGCSDVTITPGAGDTVILIMADMAALDSWLAMAAEDPGGEFYGGYRPAIIANAKNPDAESDDAVLLNATTGFCFRPSGRYTIEAVGVVNDGAGREVKRMRIRRVVALDRGTNSAWTLERQSDFDEAIVARKLEGLITLPGASYVASVPASGAPGGAGVSLGPVSESGDGWGFDGPSLFASTNWHGASRGAATFNTLLTPGEDLYKDGNKGIFVSDTKEFRAFASPAPVLVDSTLRRILVWVKPAADFAYGADHVFFDSGLTDLSDAAAQHLNRILLAYSSSGRLILRIGGEARENRSGELRAPVTAAQFSAGVWHRIEALWSGMDIGQMALILDGVLIGSYSPSGADAEQTASPGLSGEKWVARVGNYLKQEGETDPVRDTQVGTTSGPKSVYGYGACRFINKDASTEKGTFNKVHRGGATLGREFGVNFATVVAIQPTDPPTPDPKIATDTLIIPVTDASAFPKEGYVKIGNEVIKYTDWVKKTGATGDYYELTVPADGRGQDFGTDDLATKFTSDPEEHLNGASVVCISVKVSSNANYPMPQLLDVPANVESYFGLTDLDPNACYVQIGDEWFSYTHRAGTEFVVHVQARAVDVDPEDPGAGRNSSMRGAGGTTVAAHSSGVDVIPVYEVTAGGRLGGGDRVTLLDDGLAPGTYQEFAAKHAVKSRYGYLVSFPEFLPAGMSIYVKKGTTDRNARVVKFPSGRFRPRRLVSIGAPMSGAGSRADSTIGCVRMFTHAGSNTTQRVKDPITDATEYCVFGTLDSLYNGGTEWEWTDRDFGVGSWPLEGYVKIGDEAFFYKVRYPHNITYSSTLGARSNSCSVQVQDDVAATGNIVWTQQGMEDDPVKAGFNPYGGYLVITSYKRTETPGTTKSLKDVSDDLLQWLIQHGHITQEYVDDHGTKDGDTGLWSFPDITEEGGWSTSEKREFVFYTEINPKLPGAGQYTFVCAATGRHLYGTHMDGATPLGHESADDGEGGTLYPRLTARTVAMNVLQRGGAPGTLALGTSKAQHDAGSRIMPLLNVPTTIICGPPLDENDDPAAAYEGDKIPVEDVSNFPESGYLEITNAAGEREIIYYTKREEMTIAGSSPERRTYFFSGIRRFRGRFGTKPIDLTGLAVFDDVRNTSPAQTVAYRDARRAVKLFRPRFHDRMPLQTTMNGAIEDSREYAPHATDADMVYFEAKKTVRGAKWLSVDWTEAVPANTDIIVLARVGDSPEWGSAAPVLWHEVPANSGRVIYKFDAPKSAVDDNAINAAGDTITLRVYFKFNAGYAIAGWQAPVLNSLTLKYKAGPNVIESQELNY